jgi:exosortase
MSVSDDKADAAPQSAWLEFREYWERLPNKALFLGLLGAWIVLFHFWGVTQFNFTSTPSLFQWMYGAWEAPAMDSSHGKLVPFVVLGLLWFKRDQLARCTVGAGWLALPLLAVALALHAAGFLAQQPRLSMVAFFLGLYSLIGAVWGWEAMKATFFPLVLFGFCLPLGTTVDNRTLHLRLFAAKTTLVVVRDMLGIPVIRHGTQLLKPDGTVYEVAAECSGIRSIVALFGITTVYAMLKLRKWWKRALIILLTVPLAVVCNVLRLVTMIVAAQAFGNAAGTFVHEWFGYVTYAIALVCLMLVGGRLRDSESTAPPPTPSVTPVYGAL